MKDVIILASIYSAFIYPSATFDYTTLCESICPSPVKTSPLLDFCTQRNTSGHLGQLHSCCRDNTLTGNESIVGLDFSSCELQNREDRNEVFSYLSGLEFLMLENNTGLQLTDDAFRGLTILKNLSLPVGMGCPGGNRSWQHQEQFPDKVLCYKEVNLCLDKNVTCPNKNSQCVFMGPGQLECLCNQGFHGYKCLRQGKFPSVPYTVILCACTVILAIGMWCIQRRKIKKH